MLFRSGPQAVASCIMSGLDSQETQAWTGSLLNGGSTKDFQEVAEEPTLVVDSAEQSNKAQEQPSALPEQSDKAQEQSSAIPQQSGKALKQSSAIPEQSDKAQQQPSVVPVHEQPAQAQMTAEAKAAALENYSKKHGLDISNVTMEQIDKSPEGSFYWATQHQDTSGRGPGAQALSRAFKYRPDVKASYGILLDEYKVEFRRSWMATKSFDFVTTTRTTTNTYRKRRDEVGVFKTRLQIEVILGGSDKAEARLQTDNYITMCMREDLKAHDVEMIFPNVFRTCLNHLFLSP